MKKDRKTQKFRYLAAVILLLGSLAGCAEPQVQFVEQTTGSSRVEETSDTAVSSVAEVSRTADSATVYVHVCGAVKEAGVYELPADARVFEAIRAAGGLAEDAAGERVNQARILTDGEELYIPTKDEILSASAKLSTLPGGGAAEQDADNRININTADADTLTSLNGIGKSRAEAIIAWREENGGFSSIEEIKNIDGIADKTYEKLKDRITVN